VVEAMLRYYDIGITTLLLKGFDPWPTRSTSVSVWYLSFEKGRPHATPLLHDDHKSVPPSCPLNVRGRSIH
jgi:hypothetical protein